MFHRMPYATHSRVIEGFTCERLLPPSSVCVCVISTSSEHRLQTVHESLAGLYACVLLPLCSIYPTVMCWEALIEYTIWREPASHQFGLLETQPNHNALLSSSSQVTRMEIHTSRSFLPGTLRCWIGRREPLLLTTIWE